MGSPAVVSTEQSTRACAGDDLDTLAIQFQLTKARLIANTLDTILHQETIDAEAKKHAETVDQLNASELPGGIEPTDVDISSWWNEDAPRSGGRVLE